MTQGSQRSAQFEFPDFPWHFSPFSLTFPDLMARIWQVSEVSTENLSEARKNFVPTNIGFYKIILSRNIWQNLVHLSQIKFPNPRKKKKKNWNFLTFQKETFFPDFPRFPLMLGTLVTTLDGKRKNISAASAALFSAGLQVQSIWQEAPITMHHTTDYSEN